MNAPRKESRFLKLSTRLRALISELAEPTDPPIHMKWELILALLIPSFATLCLILLLVLPIFLLDYGDVGPPLGTTHLANHWRLIKSFAFPPFGVYAIWMWSLFLRERAHEIFWPFLLWTGLVLSLLVPMSYEVFNVALDRSPPLVFRVAVTRKFVESSPLGYASVTSYVLKLTSWRKDCDWQTISVSGMEYDGVVPGKTAVTLRIGPGRFGQPWLESYQLHE